MKSPARYIPASLALLLSTLGAGCGPSDKSTKAGTAAPAPAGSATVPAKSTPGDATAGKRVYARTCFACHQPSGLGLPGAVPPLAGSAIVLEGDPGKLIRIALHGLQGPVEVKGTTYNSVMPGLAAQLKDGEIADVLTYIRSDWGNAAGPVTVESVTTVRSNVPHPAMWTWAELTR